MYILLSGIIGLFVGIGFSIFILFRRKHKYSGVMKVIREENKLVYSLELYDDPSILEHMNEVIFKVETSDESS